MTDYVLQLRSQLIEAQTEIPIWNDELYLELHRGVFTTKADQKLKNRRAEIQLTNLEKYLAIAVLLSPDQQFDHNQVQSQLTKRGRDY
jgi:alpha-mannosidase